MEIQTHQLTVKKTARYSTWGTLSEKTRYFWFVLHGSNMRCEQMLYKFAEFDPETHFVVAPEALSRFYINGFGGDVVAAWMTSRDRLEEIADFSDYLSQLYEQMTTRLSKNCKRTIVGFSQGGTTLFRWLHYHKVDAAHLIAYSCWVPEDIALQEGKTDLSEIQKIYTYGLQDQFLKEDRIAALDKVIAANKLALHREAYEGDHRIAKKQLMYLFEKYIQ